MSEQWDGLAGKVAVVTGGAQGIGFAVGKLLFEAGALVVLCDVNAEKANLAAGELDPSGERVVSIAADVGDSTQVSRAAAFVLEAFGRIDFLVNNAGIGSPSVAMHEMSDAMWESMLGVHLTGTFKMTRAVLPAMKAGGGGAIVNMSSNAGQIGDSEYSHYSAAKAGILGFTKAAAKELAPFRIRVNAVAPGLISTDILSVQPPLVIAAKEKQIPWGRLGSPRDVAASVCYLLSDGADYITGQVLCPNGGRTIGGI